MQLARSHRPCIDAATKQHLQRQCKRAAKELALSCPSAACLIQRQCKRAERELALSCPSAACLIQRLCEASAMARRGNAVLPDLTLPSRSLSYTKTMQTSEMRACSYISECSLSYTKISKYTKRHHASSCFLSYWYQNTYPTVSKYTDL